MTMSLVGSYSTALAVAVTSPGVPRVGTVGPSKVCIGVYEATMITTSNHTVTHPSGRASN